MVCSNILRIINQYNCLLGVCIIYCFFPLNLSCAASSPSWKRFFLPKLRITHYKTQCLVFKKSSICSSHPANFKNKSCYADHNKHVRLKSLRTNCTQNKHIWFSSLFVQNIFTILSTYTNLFTNVSVFCSCTWHISHIQFSFEDVFCCSINVCCVFIN